MIRNNLGQPVPREHWDISDYERMHDELEAENARLSEELGTLGLASLDKVSALEAELATTRARVARQAKALRWQWAHDAFGDVVSSRYMEEHGDEKMIEHQARWMRERGLEDGNIDVPADEAQPT